MGVRFDPDDCHSSKIYARNCQKSGVWETGPGGGAGRGSLERVLQCAVAHAPESGPGYSPGPARHGPQVHAPRPTGWATRASRAPRDTQLGVTRHGC